MTDPEKLLMKGSAQALALEPDRIAGVSTREAITSADVGMAIAGMREDRDAQGRRRYSDLTIRQVEVALYHVLGEPRAHRDLYRLLVEMIERGQRNGRLPRQLCVAQYPDLIATLAVISSALPPLDQLLAGGDADAWHRELVPVYREARGAISSWTSIGMAHVKRRTADEDDDEGSA